MDAARSQRLAASARRARRARQARAMLVAARLAVANVRRAARPRYAACSAQGHPKCTVSVHVPYMTLMAAMNG